jgi:hypothetical protein
MHVARGDGAMPAWTPLSRHEGHIRSSGIDKDVIFAEADTVIGLNDAIDADYQAKYRAYPVDFVNAVINDQARSGTVKLLPR